MCCESQCSIDSEYGKSSSAPLVPRFSSKQFKSYANQTRTYESAEIDIVQNIYRVSKWQGIRVAGASIGQRCFAKIRLWFHLPMKSMKRTAHEAWKAWANASWHIWFANLLNSPIKTSGPALKLLAVTLSLSLTRYCIRMDLVSSTASRFQSPVTCLPPPIQCLKWISKCYWQSPLAESSLQWRFCTISLQHMQKAKRAIPGIRIAPSNLWRMKDCIQTANVWL